VCLWCVLPICVVCVVCLSVEFVSGVIYCGRFLFVCCECFMYGS